MNPLLFALVDAVLLESADEARNVARATPPDQSVGVRLNRNMYAAQLRQHLGWWRSLWGVL